MCELLSDFIRDNCAIPGGVAELVVYNLENRDSYVVSSGDVTVTMDSGKYGWKIVPDKEMIGTTQTSNQTRENRSYWVDQTVLCKVAGTSIAYTDFIEAIGKGTYGVIVRSRTEDSDGFTNRHYGLQNGMAITTIDGIIGRTFDEGVTDTINFVGKEIGLAPTMSDTNVEAILETP